MITTLEDLRKLYAAPKPRALAKQLDKLDPHCRHFISLAPFLVIATTGKDGRVDASPRGGAPGFVRIVDDHRPGACIVVSVRAQRFRFDERTVEGSGSRIDEARRRFVRVSLASIARPVDVVAVTKPGSRAPQKS